ncbi:hypothetical protein [Winogradskyella luteola]|uniref:Uncharacterized protein n=1 Tax=Winogradskyella luteola TaxID=2828330 RepID=A0A9X1JP54_9FLAO|nr:hypothetical protein [Winogradskyella luteola]MBV7268374.1 hypothetical protein [Winogradskyella luteola]
MSKILSKSQLQEKADKLFKDYPNAEKGYVTNDGNAFLSKNRADLHASSDEKLKVTEFENENSGVADKNNDASDTLSKADDIIEFAKTADAESAKKYLDAENEAKKPRKTVVEALKARLDELKSDA